MWLFTRRLATEAAIRNCTHPRQRWIGDLQNWAALIEVSVCRVLCLAAAATTILLPSGCRRADHRIVALSLVPALASQTTGEQPLPLPPADTGGEGNTGNPGGKIAQAALGPQVDGFTAEVNCLPNGGDCRPTWLVDEQPQGQEIPRELIQPDWSFRCPLWGDARNEWAASGSLHNQPVDYGGRGTDRAEALPDDVWNVQFTSSYRHRFLNGWIGGGGVSVGSVSERPFNSWSDLTAGINAFLQIPQHHGSWKFSLSYSLTGDQPAPTSKVECSWQPSEHFQAKFGLILPSLGEPLEEPSLDLLFKLYRPVPP